MAIRLLEMECSEIQSRQAGRSVSYGTLESIVKYRDEERCVQIVPGSFDGRPCRM